MTVVQWLGKRIAILDGSHRIEAVEDLLDLMADVGYVHGCRNLVITSESLPSGFFSLASGIAGELLQKCSNYRFRVAITGDFSGFTSKSLRDFIYECNTGGNVCFTGDIEAAVERLSST